ncbi:uncharacterized protein CIMG_13327 [Coccidioides immitis RS]|uniref:Uncharacterized protein n=1 Tax=Coccidioides immitis (strain RS) TaxID=246410 RepID=A0A0E1S0M0_COCIM|nr:uncharacterized protein CIMG_13327 [Coccidioides immitis RS]EAS28804.2 hypothetical protein CIMG_13327 [Coccidioides immitis RS]
MCVRAQRRRVCKKPSAPPNFEWLFVSRNSAVPICFRNNPLYRLEYPCVHRVASTAVFLFAVALHGALLAKWNLRAQGGGWLSVFIAKHVAFRIFVGENQKLVVLEWQAELP